MKPERGLQLVAGPGGGTELGKEPELDGGEQHLGRPEPHADFHDASGRRGGHRWFFSVSGETVVV